MNRSELFQAYHATSIALDRPENRNLTLGRCARCQLAFAWRAKQIRLADAQCPCCDNKLAQTTRALFRNVTWLIVPESVFPAPHGYLVEMLTWRYDPSRDRDRWLGEYIVHAPTRKVAAKLVRDLKSWINSDAISRVSSHFIIRPIFDADYWDRASSELPYAS